MFQIDNRSRDPLHLQLQKQIVKYVSLGILEANQQLPSVRTMAQELGINPNTVQKAYRTLELNNVIYTIAGKGAFVSAEDSSLEQVRYFAQDEFLKSVESAKDTGFEKEELYEIIEQVFKRGEIND